MIYHNMSVKLSRCPNGTRRNKTTKKCEAKQTKKNKTSENDQKKTKRMP